MTRFLLLRHAAHEGVDVFLAGRTKGVLLGKAGSAQAAQLGRYLACEPLTAVYSSPCERTFQTAEAVAAATGAPLFVEPALDEIDFGRWAGSRFDALEKDPEWRRWNAARSIAETPAGESMRAVQNRILGLIERLKFERGADFALVTHADLIKAALAYYLGLSLDELQRFEVAPASISRLTVESWRTLVVCINESAERAMGRGERE